MSIRRAHLAFEDKYVQIPNEWIRDKRISRRARGLLAEIMSHKDGWIITIKSLTDGGPEGRDAIKASLRELDEAGYLKREQLRTSGNRFDTVDYVIQDPFEGGADFQSTDFQSTESPSAGNHPTKKTISSEDYSENNTNYAVPVEADAVGDQFSEVWSAWPRKDSKQKAEKAWKQLSTAKRDEITPTLLAHAKAHALYTTPTYVPYLSSWLNGGMWDNTLPAPRPGSPAASGVVSTTLTDSQGRPAPYGLTPGGRRLGPPARAGEHPRAPWLGMMLSASSRGSVFVRDRPLQMREPTENEKRILNGADD